MGSSSVPDALVFSESAILLPPGLVDYGRDILSQDNSRKETT